MLQQHVVDKDLVVVVQSILSSQSNYHFGKRVHRKAQEEGGDVAGKEPFVVDLVDSCGVHSKIPSLGRMFL